jgi:hypothetical protein
LEALELKSGEELYLTWLRAWAEDGRIGVRDVARTDGRRSKRESTLSEPGKGTEEQQTCDGMKPSLKTKIHEASRIEN